MTSPPIPVGVIPAGVKPTFSVTSSPGSIWQWWRAEIGSLSPRWLQTLLLPHARTVSLSMGSAGHIEVYDTQVSLLGTPDAHVLIFTGDQNGAIDQVAARRKRWGPLLRVELVVPASRCLHLEHRLPVSALARAAGIVALEMERTTPLRHAEVLHDFFIVDHVPGLNGSTVVQQVAIRKATVETLVAGLRVRAIPLSSIRVTGSDGNLLPVDLLSHSPARPPTASGRLNLALLAAALLGAAFAFANSLNGIWALEAAFADQTRIEKTLEQKVAALRQQFATQDTLQNRAKGLRLRKIETVSALHVWEEVTQRLPASAWISELRLDDGTLYLDGFSRSASELVGIFARSPYFTKVEFVSPVTRDAQHGVERFQLRMKVERKPTAAAGQTAIGTAPP